MMKNNKNILLAILSVLVVAAIVVGIVLLTDKSGKEAPASEAVEQTGEIAADAAGQTVEAPAETEGAVIPPAEDADAEQSAPEAP